MKKVMKLKKIIEPIAVYVQKGVISLSEGEKMIREAGEKAGYTEKGINAEINRQLYERKEVIPKKWNHWIVYDL